MTEERKANDRSSENLVCTMFVPRKLQKKRTYFYQPLIVSSKKRASVYDGGIVLQTLHQKCRFVARNRADFLNGSVLPVKKKKKKKKKKNRKKQLQLMEREVRFCVRLLRNAVIKSTRENLQIAGKAQIRPASKTNALLICALWSADFLR